MALTLLLVLLGSSFSSAEVRSRQSVGGAVAKRESGAISRAAAQVQARTQNVIPYNPAPQPAFNTVKAQSFVYVPAAAPVVEKPAKSIQDEYLEKWTEPKAQARGGSDRVILHGSIGEKGQPNAVIVEDGTEASAVSVSPGEHNRDQGGKPSDPNGKGKGNGKDR